MNSILTLLLASLLPGLAALSAAPTSDPNDLANFPRLRGMTVPHGADATVFHDAAANGANAVRLILSPLTTSASHPAAGWQKMVENLPSQLEAAKKEHIIVIVSLFTPPVDRNFGPSAKDEERKAALHAFWTDPNSLDVMIAQAVQTARLLKPYEGMVWLELKNEPLDWADYPAIPHNWPVWAQKLVDAVRAVSAVPIVVQVGPGGFSSGFATFSKLKGDNLVYSLHNYQPLSYTHQGVKQLIGTDLAHPYDQLGKKWPAEDGKGGLWDKERLRKEFEPVIRFARENKVRIYVGEFGVARWAPNAEDYLRDNIELFEEQGWDWTYHAFRESAIWSFEHDETYSDRNSARLSTSENARAKVIRAALSKNQSAANKK
jgi:aryl-phospho-beta-D-glucosidase BglC (GH1 family)